MQKFILFFHQRLSENQTVMYSSNESKLNMDYNNKKVLSKPHVQLFNNTHCNKGYYQMKLSRWKLSPTWNRAVWCISEEFRRMLLTLRSFNWACHLAKWWILCFLGRRIRFVCSYFFIYCYLNNFFTLIHFIPSKIFCIIKLSAPVMEHDRINQRNCFSVTTAIHNAK